MKKTIFLYAIICIIASMSVRAYAASHSDNYTVIVSLDGFRWDYPNMYDTPFFDKMAHDGISAVMRPSFPSKTFPNHYTLATGLVPDHHGIIANSFIDREQGKYYTLSSLQARNDTTFYGGEPIWQTAKRQGVKVATVYWVGSDVPSANGNPDYWYDYNKKPLLSFSQRVDAVIDILKKPESQRPRLVMLYFEEPDGVGHRYSPYSKVTRATVESLDSIISSLNDRLQALPIGKKINLIVTSDHGMTPISPDRTIAVKKYLKDEWIEKVDGNLPGQIYCKPGCADLVVNALKDVPHLKAWKREDIPAYLQYGSNTRIGDVVALPDPGWLFTDNTDFKPGGAHGFDPYINDMHVMFRAIGPDFKKGYLKSDKFQNVCVYPLLAHLLGITPAPNDGNLDAVKDILNE